jgi:hypothetical protein
MGSDNRSPDLFEQARLKKRLLLRPLTGGCVLNHRQRTSRPTVLVPDDRRAHACPDRSPVLMHVALLGRVLWLIFSHRMPEALQVLLAVLGARDLGERQAEQLPFGIAGNPAQRWGDAQ